MSVTVAILAASGSRKAVPAAGTSAAGAVMR